MLGNIKIMKRAKPTTDSDRIRFVWLGRQSWTDWLYELGLHIWNEIYWLANGVAHIRNAHSTGCQVQELGANYMVQFSPMQESGFKISNCRIWFNKCCELFCGNTLALLGALGYSLTLLLHHVGNSSLAYSQPNKLWMFRSSQEFQV